MLAHKRLLWSRSWLAAEEKKSSSQLCGEFNLTRTMAGFESRCLNPNCLVGVDDHRSWVWFGSWSWPFAMLFSVALFLSPPGLVILGFDTISYLTGLILWAKATSAYF